MASKEKCAHPSCECMVSDHGEFGKYCSSWCEAAKDTLELRCECGHPECAEEHAVKSSGSVASARH